jgi:AraC family transcriptional regulator, regulatory protein of adaptative response / DNA-3-methyladenine glycosylase II
LDARDARFDGIFFVGITSTRIYCRPVCPARVSCPTHRRFFHSAAAAEHAGFRPCLRCRPELAPGHSAVDAVSTLAHAAERRIASGALNGRTVADLARELGVSERHLRRALERELGVSPLDLAQTHRLLLAKRLLADTTLTVTQVAYASGFQSLRRFNTAFREAYRMPPSAVRRPAAARRVRTAVASAEPTGALLRLTLTYRAPFHWDALLGVLARDALPGVDFVEGRRYARTVCIDGRSGYFVADDAWVESAALPRDERVSMTPHLRIGISSSLVPVLMPLLARLRRLFDLDADPTVVDSHLAAGGLAESVSGRPGLRIPGGVDGFDVALRILLRGSAWPLERRTTASAEYRVVEAIGEPVETGLRELSRLAPSAARIADAGEDCLVGHGVPRRRAGAVVALARLVANDGLRLEPGDDPDRTRAALKDVTGAPDHLVETILIRALGWPDAFPASDRCLQRAADAGDAQELVLRAREWRPWRSYAAVHLWTRATQDACSTTGRRVTLSRRRYTASRNLVDTPPVPSPDGHQ